MILPRTIDYLANPPSRDELVDLIRSMDISVRPLLRQKGTPYDALDLGDSKWTDVQLIAFMMEHPILINRPIVVTPSGARLCRPSAAVVLVFARKATSTSSAAGAH